MLSLFTTMVYLQECSNVAHKSLTSDIHHQTIIGEHKKKIRRIYFHKRNALYTTIE